MADAAKNEFRDLLDKVIPVADKMKTKMLKKGIALAKTECPECGSWLYGRIIGKHQHLHMACENKDCCMRMME